MLRSAKRPLTQANGDPEAGLNPCAAGPCAVCGHLPTDPLPPGRILKNARLSNLKTADLTADQFLERAGSRRGLSWFSDLENHRKTIPAWAEWTALCEVARIDPAAAAAGERVDVGEDGR